MAVKLLRKYIVFKTLVKLLLHMIIGIQFTFIYLLKENFEAQIAAMARLHVDDAIVIAGVVGCARTSEQLLPFPLHPSTATSPSDNATVVFCYGRFLLF